MDDQLTDGDRWRHNGPICCATRLIAHKRLFIPLWMNNRAISLLGSRSSRWLLTLVLSLLVLSGCNRSTALDAMSFPEDRALARQAIDDLIKDDRTALAGRLHHQLRPQLGQQFDKMREALPFDGITEKTLVDASWVTSAWLRGKTVRNARLVFELVGGNERALVQITISRHANMAEITGLQINKIDRPAADINAFRFGDMTFANALVAVAQIGALIATILAIRRIWSSGLFRRRWLWIAGCLFGLGRCAIAWGSDQLHFTPFFVQLLSVGAMRMGFLGVWQLSVSIPAVAIWALVVHHRRRSGEEDSSQADELS
jgi:hypothetical protein